MTRLCPQHTQGLPRSETHKQVEQPLDLPLADSKRAVDVAQHAASTDRRVDGGQYCVDDSIALGRVSALQLANESEQVIARR